MIHYYITAHGYGHGVRSSEVASALRRLRPDVPLTVVSALPSEFLAARIAEPYEHRVDSFDVGMVQRDSVRIDEAATTERLWELVRSWDRRVEVETQRLEGASLVVADIPGIPLEAAARAGVPSAAIGNFTWNWIYEPYAERYNASGEGEGAVRREGAVWGEAADRFAQAYGLCPLLLRLPFSEPMSAFPHAVDLPLLSEPGRDRRRFLAERYGADPAKRWILISFTTLDWDEEALTRVRNLSAYEFFTVLPLKWEGENFFAVDPGEIPFRDVLTSCDAVLTKPGYGIVSESIVARKPIIHAERTGFQEYPILVEAIEQHLPEVFLPESNLYRGEISEVLARIWTRPDPGRELPRGGAEIAARELARFL